VLKFWVQTIYSTALQAVSQRVPHVSGNIKVGT
jgi:hypothetical protein